MNPEWLLQRLAASVFIVAFNTVYYALFIKWSLVLTARMLGTPAPQLGTVRTLGMGLCVAVMNHLIYQIFALAASGAGAVGFTLAGVITVPTHWFIIRPFEFFLLAGLMIRFLPTTFGRGCLVSLNFQLLTTVVMSIIIIGAILS